MRSITDQQSVLKDKGEEEKKFPPRTSSEEGEYLSCDGTANDSDIQFLSWYFENGGWMSPKLSLGNFEGFGKGLSIKTTSPSSLVEEGTTNKHYDDHNHVRKGEIMLKVPTSLLITSELCTKRLQEIIDIDSRNTGTATENNDASTSTSSPPALNLDEIMKGIETNTMFPRQNILGALFFMWEMSLGQGVSFYYPYLQTLPHHVGLASSFTNEELELFQETQYVSNTHLGKTPGDFAENYHSVVPMAKAVRDGLSKLWHNNETSLLPSVIQILKRQSPNPSFWTYENFQWCRQLVTSRSIAVSTGTDMATITVPMADKINHNSLKKQTMLKVKGGGKFESLNHVRNETTGVVTIKADHKIKPGEQFMEMYGNSNNQWFVIWGGFVPPINYFHYVSVPLPSLPPSIEPIRQALGLPSIVDNAKVKSTNEALNSYIWQYLDLVLLAESPSKVELALTSLYGFDDLTMLCEIVQVACQKTSFVNSKMRAIIQSGARTALSKYPASLEEDKVTLHEWEQKPKRSVQNGIRRENAIVAIQFRIQEKEYLTRISNEIIDDDPSTPVQTFSARMVLVAMIVVVISFWNSRKRNRHFTGVGRTASR